MLFSNSVEAFNRVSPNECKQEQQRYLRCCDITLLILISLLVNVFSLAVPLVSLQIYDRILNNNGVGTLNVLCAGVVIVVILDAVLKLCRSSIITIASAKFEHETYTGSINQLIQAKMRSVQKYSPAEWLHRLGSISKMKNFFNGQALMAIIDIPFVVIYMGLIAYLAGWLVCVPIGLLVLYVGYAYIVEYSVKRVLVSQNKGNSARIKYLSDILEKIHTVKMLGLEKAFLRGYEEFIGSNVSVSYNVVNKNAQMMAMSTLFTQLMMIAMVSFGAMMVLAGQLTMGGVIACVLLSGRIMQPIQRAMSLWMSYQEYKIAQKDLNEITELEETQRVYASQLDNPKGKLEIKDLVFSYKHEAEKTPLLNGINLSLKPGTIMALQGNVGDGRKTLLKLIVGLYQPDSGTVVLDGVEAGSYPMSEISKYVGYLPSDAQIFNGTIIDNITGFRKELEDKVPEMAKLLGFDSMVSKLPKGYQTVLSNSLADPLTPGIKQRITIARVLINRPKLLLFDFADKSLDREGYNHVFRLLGQIKGQATMIIVSNDHNLMHLAHEEYRIESGKLIPQKRITQSTADTVTPPLEGYRS